MPRRVRFSFLPILLWVLVIAPCAIARTKGPNGPPPPESVPRDLTLSEAIALALRGNLDLLVEQSRIPEAQGAYRAAQGDFDPQFTIRLDRTYRERLINQYDSASLAIINTLQNNAILGTIGGDGVVGELDPDQQTALEEGLRSADLNVREFEEDVRNFRSSLSQLLPFGTVIELSANAVQTENSTTLSLSSTNIPIYPFYPYQNEALAYARITQPLLRDFGFAANLVGIRVTRANKKQADAEFLVAVHRIVAAVADSYFDYAYAIQSERVLADSVKAAGLLVDQTLIRLEEGTVDMIELRRAEAELASRQDGLLATRNITFEQRNRLLRLLTTVPDYGRTERLVPVDGVPSPKAPTSESLEQLALQARAKRPEYTARFAEIDGGTARLQYAQNQMLPQVDVVAGYGLRGLNDTVSNVAENVFQDQDKNEWSVGVVASFPIGNRDAAGRRDRARALLDRSRDTLFRLDAQVRLEIANALDSCRTGMERIKTAAVARKATEDTLHGETRRLEEGQGTVFAVVEAQRDQRTAELRELFAQLDLAKSQVALVLARGSTLEIFGITVEPGPSPKRPPTFQQRGSDANTRPAPSKK